ncbi:CAP domain-containing protein [Actinoplanes sp. DH11]|uniref:CAP domain-containing protein n=1 Tax=Actinoplanes sp. DH11 TaxID=2857011 RepID=UPI001E42D7D2|nr:CAP domain-containing protein [Actinoplanes sp. DH11]
MFDLVVRRVVLVAATPALLAIAAPALGTGPILPPRPMRVPPPVAQPAPDRAPQAAPRAVPSVAAGSPAATPGAATQARLRARAAMLQVVRLTNDKRRAAGCPALSVEPDLITASLRQSWYMARTRLFSHVWRDGSTFVARSRVAGYPTPAGENIGWGYRTAREVVEAWMDSPGHRANILNCGAKAIGTGVAYAADGTPYYTQVFGWQ